MQYSAAVKAVLYNLWLQPIEGNEGREDTVHGDESEVEVLISFDLSTSFVGLFPPQIPPYKIVDHGHMDFSYILQNN